MTTNRTLILATPAADGVVKALRAGLAGAGQTVDVLTLGADDTRKDIAAKIKSEGVGLIVVAILPGAAVTARPLVDTPPDTWRAACTGALKLTFHAAQAIYDSLAPRGGVTMVIVGPNFGLSGAAQLVPLTALAEGQRGLVKAIARQWAPEGFAVHWLALGPAPLHEALGAVTVPKKADPKAVAFDKAFSAEEAAPLLAFLASSAGRRTFTGATLMFDGGEWMVP